jgi:hypothetical protein
MRFDIGCRPAAWFPGGVSLGIYTLPQHRAVGQFGRTPHCLEPTVHSGRSGEAFPLRGRRGTCYQRRAAFDR